MNWKCILMSWENWTTYYYTTCSIIKRDKSTKVVFWNKLVFWKWSQIKFVRRISKHRVIKPETIYTLLRGRKPWCHHRWERKRKKGTKCSSTLTASCPEITRETWQGRWTVLTEDQKKKEIGSARTPRNC